MYVSSKRFFSCIKAIKDKMNENKAPDFRLDDEGVLWYKDRICVPADPEIRQLILHEAHDSRYSIHPGNSKMYNDLRTYFWWEGMKREIAEYVAMCDICKRVKAEYRQPAGLLKPLYSHVEMGEHQHVFHQWIASLSKGS